jgi:hypothetical protein
MMWGQECYTHFSSEESAFDWLGKMYDKGWLHPIEVLAGKVVLYTEEEIVDKVGQ